MSRLYLVMVFSIMLLLVVGCHSKTNSNILSQEDIILELQNEGYQVSYEKINKNIYDGECYLLTIDENEVLYVYVYPSEEKAKIDISYIGSSGGSYDNGKMGINIEWVSIPYYYHKDNLLLMYIGENDHIIKDLSELYGDDLFSHVKTSNRLTTTLKHEDIIKDMESKNYQVTYEKTDKDILEGERYWLTLDDNEHLGVYVYESAVKASEDASYIDSKGGSYASPSSNIEIDWISYPHFYQKENIIILYVGESEEIINDLTELYGEMFAGTIQYDNK